MITATDLVRIERGVHVSCSTSVHPGRHQGDLEIQVSAGAPGSGAFAYVLTARDALNGVLPQKIDECIYCANRFFDSSDRSAHE